MEVAKNHEDGDDGEAEADLVGDHLGAGADAAEEGVFGVGGPAGDGDAVNGEGGDGEDEEGADVEVGDGEGDGTAIDHHRAAEGDDGHGDEGGDHGHAGGEPEENFADVGGDEVFLEDEFESVGEGLGEATEGKWEVFFEAEDGKGDAGAVGADAVLNDGGETSFGIDRVGDEGEDDAKDDADFDGDGEECDEVHGFWMKIFLQN